MDGLNELMEPGRTSEASLKAVIFDVDGTLVDSERDGHRIAFNAAFEEAGLDFRWEVDEYGDLLVVTGGDRRIHHYLVGSGVEDATARELAKRLHARKTEILIEMVGLGHVAPRPGVRRLLDELVDAGVPVAVATTGRAGWVHPLLEFSFAGVPFETIVTGDDVPALKPDPSAYVLAAERLGVAPGSALAIEDSRNGLLAAQAAGMQCLVVANDYSREQDFGGAALVLEDFGEDGTASQVLADPRNVAGDARLDLALLRRLVAGAA